MLPRTKQTTRRPITGAGHLRHLRRWLGFGALAALIIALAAAPSAAPLDELHGKTCTTSECHPMPDAGDAAIAHVPFLEQWCDRCHTDHTGGTPSLLLTSQPDMCLSCHTNVEMAGGALVHPAGETNCTSCHDPHSSGVRHLLVDDEHLLGCVGCHGEELAREREKPYHHKFFDPAKECGSCHLAHSNSEGGYLRENVGETCLTCHDMSLQVDGRKLENVGHVLARASHVHEPAAAGSCQSCHTPHGSVQPSLLKDSYPAGNYEKYETANYQLCWQCHDPGLVESSPTRTATEFRDGSLNLHQVHVMKYNKGRACHLCHTGHASERSHLLRESIRFQSWDGPFEYEVTPDGGRCATACHRPLEYNRSSQ